MGPAVLVVVFVIVVFAGFTQTVAGFGYSLIAVPPLGLVLDPKDAVAVAMVGLLCNSVALAWSERAHLDWSAAAWLLVGAAPGLPLGLWLLHVASADALRLGLAAAVVASVVVLVSGFEPRREGRIFVLGAGFVTGALTTSLNTNGPPTVLALQARHLEPHQFRPTSSAVLGSTALLGFALFAGSGRFTADVTLAAAVSVPGLYLGWLAGAAVRGRVSPVAFRRFVLGLLMVAAAATVLTVIG